jgi:copper(I)-binding protein
MLTVSSCARQSAEGFDLRESSPNAGASASASGILLRNAFIIGGAAGAPLQPGAHAPMYLVLMSQSAVPDRLVAVNGRPAFQSAVIPAGGLSIPPRQIVGEGPAPQVLLTGLTQPLLSGSFIAVELVFQNAGTVKIQVPVLPPTLWRATYSPWPSPPVRTGGRPA